MNLFVCLRIYLCVYANIFYLFLSDKTINLLHLTLCTSKTFMHVIHIYTVPEIILHN